MKRAIALLCLLTFGCASFGRKPKPEIPRPIITEMPKKFGASLLFPGGSSGGGGGGSVTQGTTPWVIAAMEDSTLTTVRVADNANKAVRVNVVAGSSSGAVAQGSSTSGQTGPLVQGAVTTNAPSYSNTTTNPLSLDPSGGLRIIGEIATSGSASNLKNLGVVPALVNSSPPSLSDSTMATLSLMLNGNLRTDTTSINGVTPLMGNGVTGTGSSRVTIASDNTAFSVNANAGTNLNTSALALDTSVNALSLAQGSATAGQKAVLNLGAVTTAAPSYTTAQSSPLSLTLAGSLRSDVNSIAGTTALTGNGATGAGSQRVTIANDNTAFTVNAAESGTWTVQPGNTANTTAWLVAGGKTNNAAAPGATNLGSIGALANASPPSWTEGNLVLQSVLLNGNARTDTTSINGVVPLMGNGVTGTGSLRVTLASDTTTNSNPFNVGNKTNNNAAPGATNIGALPALANASAPSWTEGNLVLQSVLLNGNGRTDMTSIAGTAPTVNNGTVGAGSLRVTIASDSTGNIATIGTSVVPGTSATHLGKAEDAAHASSDTGVMALAVRNQTGTIFANADGDYSPIGVDDSGAVFTRGAPSTSWNYHEDSSSALTTATVHAACGASLFNYITSFTVSSNAATAVTAKILDSTTTTILGAYALEAVAGRGFSVVYPGGKKQTTSNTLVSVTTTGAVAKSVDITGFCAP